MVMVAVVVTVAIGLAVARPVGTAVHVGSPFWFRSRDHGVLGDGVGP